MAKTLNINTEIKQHGHRQAMTKTFLRIKTRPEEYTPIVNQCFFNEITHCELCGAALTYSFNLIHAEDLNFTNKLSLKVGADCIYNFCQIYMPSSAAQILHTIEQSLATSKISKFKTDNPLIFSKNEEIKKQIKNLQLNYGYSFLSLNSIKEFQKLNRELVRNLYLSKPKVKKIENLHQEVFSEKFSKMLNDHKNKPLTKISETKLSKKEKHFYELYKELYPIIYFYNFSDGPILSQLEQLIFKEKIMYKVNNTNARNWLTQFCEEPDIAVFLLTQSFAKYTTELSAQLSFKKLIPLSPHLIKNLKEGEVFINIKENLPKLPKVWHNIKECLTLGKKYEI